MLAGAIDRGECVPRWRSYAGTYPNIRRRREHRCATNGRLVQHSTEQTSILARGRDALSVHSPMHVTICGVNLVSATSNGD